MIEISPSQKEAITKLYNWFNKANSQYITLGGYAGTGKTTSVALFRRLLLKKSPETKVAFCSYTGKGSLVLKAKLSETAALQKKDFVGTIHSLIYSPIENNKGVIIGWKLKDKISQDLIIVDEASMVDSTIWNDLLSYNKPIIAVGDHGQLPPIQGKFNLMEKPQILLSEIHRQAQDNPIIKVATIARKTGEIPVEVFGEGVEKVSMTEGDAWGMVEDKLSNYSSELMVLCGYNHTRVKINNFVRTNLGFYEQTPMPGDKVICLRNNHLEGIFNGMTGHIENISQEEDDWYFAEIKMNAGEVDLDFLYKGMIYAPQFNLSEPVNFTKDRAKAGNGDLFDFGYALTVHKAQGSEAESVILFEERFAKMDDETWKRWLYTGVTRARSRLFIVGT